MALRALRRSATTLFFASAVGSYRILYWCLSFLDHFRRVRHRCSDPPEGIIVVTCGRIDNLNWSRAHLSPLLGTSIVRELIAVMDGDLISHPKLTVRRSPESTCRFLPRSLARTLYSFGVIFRARPDVIIGYSFMPAAIGALVAGRLMGAMAIYQMCGGPAELANGGLVSDAKDRLISEVPARWQKPLERAARSLCKLFDGIVVRGRRAQEYMESFCDEVKTAIIPGSVDAERFVSADDVRKYDVVFLGRFVPDKQPELLLEVIAEVARTHPHVRCLFAGDGPLLESARARAIALGLEQNISFPGRIANIQEVLCSAKVFLLTSRSEGLSIALAEAMMAGAVPVVSDVGDLRELVRDGITGWLVPPGDVAAYSRRITELLNNVELWRALSHGARALAVENNADRNVTRKWEGFFQYLFASEPPAAKSPIRSSQVTT